ncbi:hypothetical protein ElyMa_000359100 [Elysia marginata]|uniref:DDE Tnp4 domain-containing protein n=1 Tax=Elysia marginata TaxID=1093978 RepID=A0AAV4FG48_9GAST|nr:hypothetical protein ElyMa_000359100 [Elysia marginata]
MFGSLPGRRHDSALLAQSGLMDELARAADGFVIYGDQAYPLGRQLIAPYRGAAFTLEQQAFNRAVSPLRLCVEWSFGKVVQYFAFLDFKIHTS